MNDIPGQAETSPDMLDDLASFLVDNPEADTAEKTPPAAESDEDTPAGDDDKDAPVDEEADDESEESEDAKEPASSLKFKVPVKGEDGTETTVEVDQKELVAGYQRQADYTRKTMALADREREAFQVVTAEIEKGRAHYMEQAQLAQAAVRQLAGIRSPQQMAQLAQEDPASWVAEQQRAAQIQVVLQSLEQGVQNEQRQTALQQEQQNAQKIAATWQELAKDGIDRPALLKLYESVGKTYGKPIEYFAGVNDATVVKMMRDALAYNDLKNRKAAVTKKVAAAPQLPAARQSTPRNEQKSKALGQRFTNGKAKLDDLAAYLENM